MSIEFYEVTFRVLRALDTSGAYAGGTTSQSVDSLKKYIRGRGRKGLCSLEDFQFCYYFKTKELMDRENDLLEMGFDCNQLGTSGLPDQRGFVYVLTNEEID